jgi:hypothetical protein
MWQDKLVFEGNAGAQLYADNFHRTHNFISQFIGNDSAASTEDSLMGSRPALPTKWL